MKQLVIDVGATSIKWTTFVNEERGSVRRRRTPSPCSVDELTQIVVQRVNTHAPDEVALGFPGTVLDGVVLDPANLARLGGTGGEVVEAIYQEWLNCDFQDHLATHCGQRVTVVNDAVAASAGVVAHAGRALVVTLGTGCGVALKVDGELVPIRDCGSDLIEGETLDCIVGEAGRRRDETRWRSHVPEVLRYLSQEFEADAVHLAGGNAQRFSPREFEALPWPVYIERQPVALDGLHRILSTRDRLC